MCDQDGSDGFLPISHVTKRPIRLGIEKKEGSPYKQSVFCFFFLFLPNKITDEEEKK